MYVQFLTSIANIFVQIVGPYATAIESMTDAEISAEAVLTLRGMFGASAVPAPIGCAHSQWGSDPLAMGSWSYFPYRPTVNAADEAEDCVATTASSDTPQMTISTKDSTTASAALVMAQLSLQAGFTSDGNSTDASYASSVFSTRALSLSMDTASVPGASPLPLSQLLAQSATNGTVFNTTAAALRSPQKAVSISQAAAGVSNTATPQARAPRKYSDFGYTSDGTDSGSSDSDDSTSSSSSSDDDSEDTSPATLQRSEDDILSSHLCYASEAMSVLNRGTVHGAYMSGIREATKILSFLDVAAK